MGIYFKATSVIGIQIIPHNQDQEADLHQQFSIVRHLIAWNSSFFSENTRFYSIKEAMQTFTAIIFLFHMTST